MNISRMKYCTLLNFGFDLRIFNLWRDGVTRKTSNIKLLDHAQTACKYGRSSCENGIAIYALLCHFRGKNFEPVSYTQPCKSQLKKRKRCQNIPILHWTDRTNNTATHPSLSLSVKMAKRLA